MLFGLTRRLSRGSCTSSSSSSLADRMVGLAIENQSTPDSGRVINGVTSRGSFQEANSTPHVSQDLSRRAGGGEPADVLPPAYVQALLEVDGDVVSAMKDCLHVGDVNMQLSGARALRQAARDFPHSRAALGAAGAARALLVVLREPEEKLQAEALQGLINLTCDCPENRVLIATASMDALDVIVEQLKSEVDAVQERAAELVFSLSLDNSNKSELCLLGAIPLLVRLLSRAPTTSRVVCKALFNISLLASGRLDVVREGAVPPLMALARDLHTEEHQRLAEKALLVLKVLCTVHAGWDAITAVPDWGSVVVRAIRDGTPVCQDSALSIAAELAVRTAVWKQAILSQDPLPAVSPLVRAPDRRLRQKAMEVHRALTSER